MFDGGDRTAAVERLRTAIAGRPDFADALNMLRLHFYQTGQSGEAETHFRQAVAHDDSHVMAHLNLGNLLKDQQRYPAALTHLEKALRIEPGIAPAHVMRGECLLAQTQPEQAFLAFKLAVATDPTLFDGHFQLALLLTDLRMFREAAG